jgi:hypothetical protein
MAYLLWLFVGLFGGHRIYTQNYLIAVLQFFTVGGCGVWWIFDLFFISGRVDLLNALNNNRGVQQNNNQVVNVVLPSDFRN